MPWTPVEVLDPPAVLSLAIKFFPPDYSGLPPETITTGGSFRAMVDTRVEMRGEASKPLVRATLCLADGRQMHAAIAADGRHFTVENLLVEKSGAYWFRLADQDGLSERGNPRGDRRRGGPGPHGDDRAARRPTCSSRRGRWCPGSSWPATTSPCVK